MDGCRPVNLLKILRGRLRETVIFLPNKHATYARVLGPIKFQGGRFFLQEGDFFQVFKKTILVIGKGSIPLAFTDTKPFK